MKELGPQRKSTSDTRSAVEGFLDRIANAPTSPLVQQVVREIPAQNEVGLSGKDRFMAMIRKLEAEKVDPKKAIVLWEPPLAEQLKQPQQEK